MLERLSKFLFGYDFFVSYAYKDGRDYAEALVKKLDDLDFACFFDASELPPGEQLPNSLRRAITRSKALILIGTEGAINAPYVDLEVMTALKQAKVIPIDVDGIRERVKSPDLRELPWINEITGVSLPTVDVLARTSNFFAFTRRNTMTRRVVSFSAIVFFIVAVLAVWQWRVAVDQKTIAIEQRDLALSRQFASQSQNTIDKEPALGMLLAAQSAEFGATFEARDALLRAMQRRPRLEALLHANSPIRTLVFSPNARLLAAGYSGGDIGLWDVVARRHVATLGKSDGPTIQRIAFDQSSMFLAVYRGDSEPTLWDLSSDQPVLYSGNQSDLVLESRLPDRNEAVNALIERIGQAGVTLRATALHPNGDILAVSDNAIVTLWTINDGKQLGLPLSAQEPYVRTLAFSPDGLLASGSSAGTIAFWRVDEPLLIGQTLPGLEVSANSLAFQPDGNALAGGDYNGRIVQWSLGDEPSQQRSLNHGSNVHALRYSNSGEQLASYGGGELKVWDLQAAQPPSVIPMALESQSVSAIGPNLASVALGNNSGEIAIWDLVTAEPLHLVANQHSDRLLALAFHPNGKILASAGNAGRIGLLDLTTGQSTGLLQGHSRAISAIDFSADGKRLASYDSDGTLIVWETRTQAPVGKPLQQQNAYSATSAMALSPEGDIAATSDQNGAVQLWDVDTWRPLGAPLTGHNALVSTLDFGPDGAWLVSGGLGGKVILWSLSIEAWQKRACSIANRGFSAAERKTYLFASDSPTDICDKAPRD